MTRWLLPVAAVVAVTLAAPGARAQYVFDHQAGGGGFYFLQQLQPGESVEIETSGCGTSPPEDTVVYILERKELTASGSWKLITRRYNDDAGGALGACSKATYTHPAGSAAAASFWLVAAEQSSTETATADVTIRVNGASVWQRTGLLIGGTNWHRAFAAGDTVLTRPLTSGEAPGPEDYIDDTYLFVINRASGAESYFDDNAGILEHSLVEVEQGCSSACDIVAFPFGSAGNALRSDGSLTIWRQSGPDTDTDGVTDGVENFYGSSSSDMDSDNDGIKDKTELYGIEDLSTLTGSDDSEPLPRYNADPLVQDLFIEVDHMQNADHSHTISNLVRDDMYSMFYDDNAWTGRRVVNHLFYSGQNIGHYQGVALDDCPDASIQSRLNLFTIKNNPAFFNPVRAAVFHYGLVSHQLFDPTDANCRTTTNWGVAELRGSNFLMATVPIGSGGSVTQQLTVLVHEVGHNLFLDHNLNQNRVDDNSCIHSSVMNYRYSTAIMGWGGGLGYRRYSYSNGTCAASQTTTPAGYTCPNTCSASRCVPSSEESPKLGCDPNSGACDCDKDEWNLVDLRFTVVPTSGEALDLAHAALGDTQYDWLNSYFMGSCELALGTELGSRRGRLRGRWRRGPSACRPRRS